MRAVKKETLINKQFEQVSFCAPLPFRHLSYENPADCQTGQPGLRFHPSEKLQIQVVFLHPVVDLDEVGEQLRSCHELSEPRLSVFGRCL